MSGRADRVAARLDAAGVDLLLVTELFNVRYLTGFTGSNALCVVGPDTRRFVTDFRYLERAEREVEGFDRERSPAEFLAALEDGWPQGDVRLGFDDQHLTVRRHRRLREILPDRVELVAAAGIVEAERAVKEPAEIESIAAAAALADEALAEVLAAGRLAGRSERAVAAAIQAAIRQRGAEPSFEPIVASAERGASPHASSQDVEIPAGTLVTIDWGARVDGYCSDCTRTFATGDAVPDELLAIHGLVARAQAAALDAVRPGQEGREVDAVARDIISDAGHGEHFGHSLGHGVGLEVHEAPRLAATSSATLQERNVVTIEPGVYVSGLGGVRIEDLVVVGAGGARVLSGLDKAATVV